MNESEVQPVVMEGVDPFTVEVVNKYAGLSGTGHALESLDDNHALAWLEKSPEQGSA